MPTHVLGLSAYYHAAAYCLEAGGVGVGELAAVAFYDGPLLKFERLLEIYLAVAPRGFRSFLEAGPLWVKEKRSSDRALRRAAGELGPLGTAYDGELLYAEPHESHAASAFYASPFEEAAVLTVDGVGEWATASVGRGRGADLELPAELRFPDSFGLLYSAFTHYLGFRVNSGESQVMELAPYGDLGPAFGEAGCEAALEAAGVAYAADWFELDRPSPYMLLTASVRPGRREFLPAVTRVDGSARVHTVRAEENPAFHALLLAFAARTGCPVLVNTSPNVRGEPAVLTPADAVRCFRDTRLDALVLGPFVAERAEQGWAARDAATAAPAALALD